MNQFEPPIKVEVPVVLCIDDKPSVGGQPTDAYAKAAANGFRSVLTLRTAKDGVDAMRERLMVEQNKMRYFNIPATVKLPGSGQVDEFLSLIDKANHPMLVNCAFAERVAPFMMILRISNRAGAKRRPSRKPAEAGSNAINSKSSRRITWHRKRRAESPAVNQSGGGPKGRL